MTRQNQDFPLWQGDDKTVTVTVTDVVGVAVNLTNAIIRWAMSHLASSDVTQIFKTSAGGAGITITNPGGGIFQIDLDPADTLSLKADEYYHEASMEDASGNVSTLLIGTVTLKASVVRE